MTDRHTYQREVENLLAQIENDRHDLRLLKVAGVRGALLRERKAELARVQSRLAAIVSGSGEQLLAA